jgi:hypothetical protein
MVALEEVDEVWSSITQDRGEFHHASARSLSRDTLQE